MKPEDWVKLLYTYGPFALLVFFMVYGEMRARAAVKDSGVDKRVSVAVYAANWVVIFILMSFALRAWYRLTFDSEFTVRGRLEHLQGAETLASLNHDLFLSRRYGPGGNFDYEWRLITPKRLQEGQDVAFVLELGTPESEKIRNYTLPIYADFYDGEIGLSYDRQKDKLMLHHGRRDEELVPELQQARVPQRRAPFFVWKVEAQEAQQKVPLQERLEAGDPIIRQQARQELAGNTKQQLQFIQVVLTNPTSSYRAKLGVLTALNNNRCADLNELTPTALDGVIRASGNSDPNLRGIARSCLIAQVSPAIDEGFDRVMHSSSGTAVSTAELARSQLEVLYSLGVAAKDRYGSREAKDRDEFKRAVEYFQKAWGLRTAANAKDQVFFAKALYGWALALHDRSWIERDSLRKRKPDYIRAAQDKFSEFLREVRNSGNAAAYQYPQHLRQAEAYLKNPEPQSLQTN